MAAWTQLNKDRLARIVKVAGWIKNEATVAPSDGERSVEDAVDLANIIRDAETIIRCAREIREDVS